MAIFGMAGCARPASAQSATPTEYTVKAAFLYHFGQFVDWPAQAFRSADAPLTYCILGDDPFQGAIELALSGKRIGSHPTQIRHLTEVREAGVCQVLFVNAAGEKPIAEALDTLKGAPVLTVGESAHFAQEGGMIGFLLEDNKIGFEINLDAAEHAKLKISARLLALAKKVIGGPKGN